ncbi:hypothetical protein ACJW30_05G128700 [Castanea mollissima]
MAENGVAIKTNKNDAPTSVSDASNSSTYVDAGEIVLPTLSTPQEDHEMGSQDRRNVQCHLSQGSSDGYMMPYFGTPLFARNQMQGYPNQFWGSGCQVPNTDQLSVYKTPQHHIINLNHLDMLQAQQHGH